MDTNTLRALLTDLQRGTADIEQVVRRIRLAPYEDLGFAKVDAQRQLRVGFPEVIYCPGKTSAQVIGIAEELLAHDQTVLATRATPELFADVNARIPAAEYHEDAHAIVVRRELQHLAEGRVAVVAAGTADLPVAAEASLTAELMGCRVDRLTDVGVAGLHRLLLNLETVQQARAVVAVAGMEGALPSVLAGLIDRPVIAVPTSVGYGASLGGLTPLLTMLNSCAAGLAVVNIDNGFGAGYMAGMICRMAEVGSVQDASCE
ncbi:MAG: nickel pincer cofactor biosynthesis protein LarB [Chloroflexi bacterium]|nr:nickel pincer cofactor biosynthesis protein LarB [Chloroflexota bacterium]